MKKRLLYLIKFINHFTNSTLSPEKEAEIIVNYMFYKTDPLHVLAVNEEVERQIKLKLLSIRERYSKVVDSIDEKYTSEPLKIIHQLNEIQQ